jgi:tRNA A-37 threonylcarbamoyl transferase component Bud32
MPWIKGQRLQGGKYVIDDVLGQGGFGITYKALHVDLKQTVVIKTPNEYLSHDPDYEKYIERFIKEGQILARLSEHPHPHIVRVIDLFKEGAIHCLVMDFVPGEDLFKLVRRRGALPEKEIVPCIRQIGEALMLVHQAKLVHRDAHPGNIMLRSNSKAVLIDFGIAKELVPKTLSSTGNAGNHGFAPYEQMTRGSREPMVDVYCLAATLYYAITGERPTTSLARKLDNSSLIPPKQINPSISDRLNQAILEGMALEAKDRPQSMQQWLKLLEASVVVTPPSVDRVYKTEVVHSKGKPKTTPYKPATTSPRIIPWGWLAGVFFSYLLTSYSLATHNTSYIVWAVAVAGAGAWAVTLLVVMLMGGVALAVRVATAWAIAVLVLVLGVAGAAASGFVAMLVAMLVVMLVVMDGAAVWAAIVLLTIAIAVFWAVAVASVWAVAVAVAGAGAGTGIAAAAKAGDKLQKSFSKVHTFLILASTSSLGLGLGWLGHRIFHPGS